MSQKDRWKNAQRTVKLKLSQGKVDPLLQETILVLLHHQEALIQLLVEKGVFSMEEFEAKVEEEIARSLKL